MIVVKSWSFYGYLIMHGVYGEYIDMNLSIKIIKNKGTFFATDYRFLKSFNFVYFVQFDLI